MNEADWIQVRNPVYHSAQTLPFYALQSQVVSRHPKSSVFGVVVEALIHMMACLS
jgi:hypothetical protein